MDIKAGAKLVEAERSEHCRQPLEASDFACCMCYELMLDPVVGACGHDYCKLCIDAWILSNEQCGRPPACPVCRALLPTCRPAGVCIRLRETIKKLFPEEIAAREANSGPEAQPSYDSTAARLHDATEFVPDLPAHSVFTTPRNQISGHQHMHYLSYLAGLQRSLGLLQGMQSASFMSEHAVLSMPGISMSMASSVVAVPMLMADAGSAFGSPHQVVPMQMLDGRADPVLFADPWQQVLGVLPGPWQCHQGMYGVVAVPVMAGAAVPYTTSSLVQASRSTTAMSSTQRRSRAGCHMAAGVSSGPHSQAQQMAMPPGHFNGLGAHASAQEYMAQQLALQRSAQELERQLAALPPAAAAASWQLHQQALVPGQGPLAPGAHRA